MSDYVLCLIPETPEFLPSLKRIHAFLREIAKLKLGAEATYTIENNIVFVDAGENGGRITCPLCKEQLSDEWWSQAMGAAWEIQFSILTSRTPCCGLIVSLNELEYEWKVGFARFVTRLRNPEKMLSDNDLAALEQIIGCKLRCIDAYV
jgi:hypothetical protein